MQFKPTVYLGDLDGPDGNAYAMVNKAAGALYQSGLMAEADELLRRLRECASYDEVLPLIQEYVEACYIGGPGGAE